ncbi:MAG: cytochrome P450 [Chitinophagales bacterium]
MQLKTTTSKPDFPIEWNEQLAAWTVWQYADIIEILKNPLFTPNPTATINKSAPSPPTHDFSAYRSPFSQVLQKKSAWTRKQMAETAQAICKKLDQQKTFDLQKHFILPWCQQIAIRLTGIEVESTEFNLLYEYAEQVFLMTDGNNKEAAHIATSFLSQYFLQLLYQCRQFPKEDLVSLLAQNEQAPAIFIAPIVQLFVGTVTSLPLLLGNVMFTLLTHPEQAQQFITEPYRFVNELIRYAGPAQFIYRSAISDVQIGNHFFKKSDRIALLLSHANQDSQAFKNPNQFNLNKSSTAHLSLGKGAHACLGSPLIRDACAILPTMILKCFPHLQPKMSEVSWGGSQAIWGVKELLVDKE